MNSSTCTECGGVMEAGFIVDLGHMDSDNVAKWAAGAPQRYHSTDLVTSEHPKFEITTYRCDRCGLLKSYAAKTKGRG